MVLIEGHKLPTLTSQRLSLRWLEYSDSPMLYRIFSIPEVMRYWSAMPWTHESQGVELIDSIRRFFKEGTLFQWGVARRDDDAIIGTCTLAHVDSQNRRAEIGFALRQDHWGRGYMQEAVRTLLQYAFDTLQLHRIEADVDPRNDASIRLLERLRFQREGYLRERWLVGNEVNDTVYYGLLRHEWPAPGARPNPERHMDKAPGDP